MPRGGPDERPRYVVSLGGYEIDLHEVARRCFSRFVEAGGHGMGTSCPR